MRLIPVDNHESHCLQAFQCGRPVLISTIQSTSQQRRMAELERQIGRQQMEIRFLERALRQVEERRQPKKDDGAEASSKR